MSWEPTRLSEFLTEREGRIKYEDANTLGLPRIKKIDFTGAIHLDQETETKTDMIRVRNGDLVISGINAAKGAISVYQEEDDALATIHYSAYEFNPDRISVEFLSWFFKSTEFTDLLRAQVPGGIKTELKPKHILPLQVRIPKLTEQLKVAEQLNRFRLEHLKLETEINHQEQLLAKLKQAILQEAIQGKLTADWRAAQPDVEPASQLLKRIQAEKARLIAAKKLRKEKPLPKITPVEIPFEIPKGWEWCRASDVGVVIGGLTKNTTKRGGHKTVLPYLRVANVYADRLDLTDLQEIGVSDAELDKLLLEVDDLLVVEGNGSRDQVGRIARWDGSVSPCVHQNHVIKVRLGERKVAMWAIYWFLSPAGRALIEEQARTSTGLYNLSTGKVANLPIPLPPLAEQAAIVERVEALMETCRELEAEIEQSRTHAAHLLQAVLKEAFSPPVKKEEKIVAFPTGFARQLIAAEILSRHNQHGMTQMKLQKLLHVVEYEAQMDEIAGDYQRQAAGPYDNRMMYGISAGLEKQKWFKTLGRGKNATYSPMEKAGQHKKYWSHWESKHPKIDGILNLLGKLKPEQCEIVSTLYAAWNDLLIEAKSPTDEEIIAEASHPDRWHEAKAKIDPAKWPLALGWMRKHQLVPTGYGRHTRKPGAP